jgi:hypothetical protein
MIIAVNGIFDFIDDLPVSHKPLKWLWARTPMMYIYSWVDWYVSA